MGCIFQQVANSNLTALPHFLLDLVTTSRNNVKYGVGTFQCFNRCTVTTVYSLTRPVKQSDAIIHHATETFPVSRILKSCRTFSR